MKKVRISSKTAIMIRENCTEVLSFCEGKRTLRKLIFGKDSSLSAPEIAADNESFAVSSGLYRAYNSIANDAEIRLRKRKRG